MACSKIYTWAVRDDIGQLYLVTASYWTLCLAIDAWSFRQDRCSENIHLTAKGLISGGKYIVYYTFRWTFILNHIYVCIELCKCNIVSGSNNVFVNHVWYEGPDPKMSANAYQIGYTSQLCIPQGFHQMIDYYFLTTMVSVTLILFLDNKCHVIGYYF